MLEALKIYIQKYPYYYCLFISFFVTFLLYIFIPYLHPAIDFDYHFNRFYCLCESLAAGDFPNYMDYHTIDGYGYLVKLFYSDFLFVPFALLSPFIGFTASFMVLCSTLTLLCCVIAFCSFRGVFKSTMGASIFMILYSLSTYRIFTLYYRNALGESMGIIFVPLAIWGFYELIYGDRKKWYILSLAFSCIIYSHTITVVLVSVFLFFFGVLSIKQILKEPQRIKYLILSGVVCFFLTVYYIIPFLQIYSSDVFFYRAFPTQSYFQAEEFQHILQGFLSLLSFESSPKIGLMLVLPIFMLRPLLSRKLKYVKLTDCLLLISVIVIFFCSTLFPYEKCKIWILTSIQFSFRLYPIISILLATSISVYIMSIYKTNVNRLVIFCVILVFSILGSGLTNDRNGNFEELSVRTDHNSILGAEFLPVYFARYPSPFTEERGKLTIITKSDSTIVSGVSKNGGNMTLEVNLKTTVDTLELPLTQYVGYEVTLNDKAIPYFKSDHGLMSIEVKESGTVKTKYVGGGYALPLFIISCLSYLFLFIYIYWYNRKNRNHFLQ